MSKATEWAKLAPQVRFGEPDDTIACVDNDGNLVLAEHPDSADAVYLVPVEALRFARWILETFEEPKS